MKPDFIQTDSGLIARATITGVDTSKLDQDGYIVIQHQRGVSRASRIQAFEALMLLKPSVLEGLHFKYGKGTWVLHNLISHPLMQFVALGAMLVGRVAPKTARSMYDLAISIHDSTVPMPQSGKLWKPEDTDRLKGKKILITAGVPHEDIDGVRYFANHNRSEGHGFAVASYLASLGANITIITAKTRLSVPENCEVICADSNNNKIASGQDLMRVTQEFTSSKNFDAVLCLASISSVKAEQISEHKIKAKKEPNSQITLPIVGNVDVEKEAQAWGLPVMGYNTQQEFFVTSDSPQWITTTIEEIKALRHAVCETSAVEEPPQRPVFQLLQNKIVIITSGPTAEKITTTGDVITNFSSGRQGRDLAYAFAHYGAKVIYITGPTSLPTPLHSHITVVSCSSARSMLNESDRHLPADIFVGVAAVADFGKSCPEDLNLSPGQHHDLCLEQNPDILETMGKHGTQRPKLVIGFAAETDSANILEYAAGKLGKKNADMICANLVGSAIAKRGCSNNQISFVLPNDKVVELDVMSKREAAMAIVQAAFSLLKAQNVLQTNTPADQLSC